MACAVSGSGLFYETDSDSGDWLVFAHGGDGNRLCWWRQVAAFKHRFRCLTYDAPGFGLSPVGAGLGQAPADDLKSLMDEAGIERAVLIGHSMGGLAVSGVAQRWPGRVRALVMSDTPFGFHTEALQRWASEMLVKIAGGFQVLDHLFAPGFAEREPELYHLYQAICRTRLPVVPPPGPPKDQPDYSAAYIAMRDTPPVDYSTFPVPTLFIAGNQDALTLPWLLEATAKAVGGARLEVIEGAGHSPFYERTEAYNVLLTRFLAGLAG
jgi:pimeloyl-ACP methyl ester carboxylesterase